jgi:hypothetical protein
MLLVTSDWPHYHHRLGMLSADLRIHPFDPASSTHLFTDCLLIPLVLRTRLKVFQSPQGIALGWISLQSQPESYAVCAQLP